MVCACAVKTLTQHNIYLKDDTTQYDFMYTFAAIGKLAVKPFIHYELLVFCAGIEYKHEKETLSREGGR